MYIYIYIYIYIYVCVCKNVANDFLGTARMFLAVGKLVGLRVCSSDDTIGDPTLGLQPPSSLLRLQLEDVQETPATILVDREDVVNCGKHIARLVAGKPEGLTQWTGGERLNLIVVPLMQLQHCLRNRKDTLIIAGAFANEAGLTLSVGEAHLTSWSVAVPHIPLEDDAEEPEDLQTAERDSRGNRWPIGIVLALAELCPLLKKPEEIKALLPLAKRAHMLLESRVGTSCQDAAHAEDVELPNARTIRRWQVKLDLYSSLYRRRHWEAGYHDNTFFYVCSDGSPQWNYDYLVTKLCCAKIDIPPDGCSEPLAHVSVQEQVLPLATTGHGRSKVEHKLVKIIHKFKLEVPLSHLEDFRTRVRSCYSDQAAEKGMWSAPNVSGVGEPGCFLFPHAWEHPALLHIYFNALKAAFLSLKEWPRLETALRALSRFLSKKLLRDHFVRVCFVFQDDAEEFESFSGGCFDWRWEKLEGLTKQLREIVPQLLNRWRGGSLDQADGRAGDDNDEEHSTKKIVAGVILALQTPYLLWWIELMWVLCAVVGSEARWNEGCRCHGDVVIGTGRPYPKRRRVVETVVHEDDCVWKGRRTVEHAMGRIEQTCANIRAATSGTLTKIFARMDMSARTSLMGIPPLLKERLVEELVFKLKFYREYPWLILEILAPLFGGTVTQSKARGRHVLDWYDKAVADGVRRPRGFDRLLSGGHASFRRQLEAYSSTPDLPIESCSVLLIELFAYALASTEERGLEAIHGRIGAFAKQALGAQRVPCSVNALVRFPVTVKLFKDDGFVAFLHDKWLSDVFPEIMSPWCTPARVRSLTIQMRLAEIYQYDFAGQGKDHSSVRLSLRDWKSKLEPLSQKGLGDLTPTETTLCQYYRGVLQVGGVFSIAAMPVKDRSSVPASLEEILSVFSLGHADALAIKEEVFFDVVALKPSIRTEAESAGAQSDTADVVIRIIPRQNDGADVDRLALVDMANVALQSDRSRVTTMNLRAWCQSSNLRSCLTSLRRWYVSGSHSKPVIIAARGPRNTKQALPMYESPESIERVLQAALEAVKTYGEDYFPSSSFELHEDIDNDSVQRLLADGVLREQINEEFGDREFRINWARIQFRVAHNVAEPELVLTTTRELEDLHKMEKLEVMSMLLRLGWQPGDGKEPIKAQDSPKSFCLSALTRGRYYWLALCRHEFVFERGVSQLPHKKPNSFYKCLLDLSQDRLDELMQCPDLPQMLESDFASYLRGGALTVGAAALEDESLDGDDNVVEGARALPPGVVPRMPALLELHEFQIGDVKISFDNWSHSSGKRRAYVRCRNEDHHVERWCGRYRTIDGFSCVRECAAHLHAWLVYGEDRPTHDRHKFFFPTDAQVAASRALLA